jgi:hypothetical protein
VGQRDTLRQRFWERLPKLERVPDLLRRPLAARWLETAQMEHASIASFGQFALQLLKLGAPAELIERAHLAALDEIEHARICFALASAYSGESHGPAQLDAISAGFPTDLLTVVCANVDEGCVGETLAALEAREAAKRAVDPTVKAALEAIAFDEERHAQLAWAVWGWALRLAPQLRAATEDSFERAIGGARAARRDEVGGGDMERHGRLSDATRTELIARHIEEILKPAKASMWASSETG